MCKGKSFVRNRGDGRETWHRSVVLFLQEQVETTIQGIVEENYL